MKCKCGEDLTRDAAHPFANWMTAMAYCSPKGHDHDDNCITRVYRCKNGHYTKLGIIKTCHACDWKGKDSCFCCTKVEEWPEETEDKWIKNGWIKQEKK